MNKFVSLLYLISIFICASDCVEFCDVQTMDNVFNIGRIIYIHRCGEVWAFDPKERGEEGAFTRDYRFFGYARKKFGSAVYREYSSDGGYNNKRLRFTAFSFRDVECDNVYKDIERDCRTSADSWNGWSLMADNNTIVHFYVDLSGQIFDKQSSLLAVDKTQTYGKLFNQRIDFLPDLAKLIPEYNWNEETSYKIHSSLFFVDEYRLFLGIIMEDRFYCVTHLDMEDYLLDVRKWPNKDGNYNKPEYNWAPPNCFVGNVVGMFHKDGQPFIVGRVLPTSREYEDQVYTMRATTGTRVQFHVWTLQSDSEDYSEYAEHPHNLRTYFGCNVNQTNLVLLHETPRQGFGPQTPGKQPPYNPQWEKPKGRKKRSVEENEPMIEWLWNDIKREVREDWILLSFMSIIALLMTFNIYRIQKN